MKCKIHIYEAGVGVCASCLREKLFALIAAQNKPSSEFHRRPPEPAPAPPPQLVFPRSVSPYVTHRRSDASAAHRHHLFFSTPQVGPSFSSDDIGSRTRRSSGRFSVFKLLFNHDQPKSSSWFSGLIKRRGKKHVDNVTVPQRSRRFVEKGMSPAREEGVSGYSSDSSEERRLPMPTPMWWFSGSRSGRRRQQQQRSSVGAISGFAFCLSPLGRRRGGDDGRSAASFGGGSSGPSLELNGSRKLAHFGRFK